MRSVILQLSIALSALALVPAAASAHGSTTADACVSLSLMNEMAQAEQGYRGNAQAMDGTREGVCNGQALPASWSSGRAIRPSANTWVYPDGQVAIRGETFFYPSGRPAYASHQWRYPDGRVAHARGAWYQPSGARASSLTQMITATCGPHDPACTRYLEGSQRRHALAYEAAGMRFAWQSRAEWSTAPRPAPGSYRAPAPPVYRAPAQPVTRTPALPVAQRHRTVVRPVRAAPARPVVEVRRPRYHARTHFEATFHNH